MTLPSTSRTSIYRRGLVSLAAAATLLAGGLVAAPAAQATPLVDTSERDGTVVTTRMSANGAFVGANEETKKVNPVRFSYSVDLDWTGGTLRSVRRGDHAPADRCDARTRVPVHREHGRDPAPAGAAARVHRAGRLPRRYRVRRSGGAPRRDAQGSPVADVDNARTVTVQRQTEIRAKLSNPDATDGRPSRITGRVQALQVSRDGSFSWTTLDRGTVALSFDPDGPYSGSEEPVHLRDLRIRPAGTFSTTVDARQGWWGLDYAGSNGLADTWRGLPQGDHSGCGC